METSVAGGRTKRLFHRKSISTIDAIEHVLNVAYSYLAYRSESSESLKLVSRKLGPNSDIAHALVQSRIHIQARRHLLEYVIYAEPQQGVTLIMSLI
jgi:hypothetical protein